MAKAAIIIGAGVGGLAVAALLAKAGYRVTVLEKNEAIGGRAGGFQAVRGDDGQWRPAGPDDDRQPHAAVPAGGRAGKGEAGAAGGKRRRGKTSDTPIGGSFHFDRGAGWYFSPDIFERFFGLLGEDINDHLELIKLLPAFRVFFKDTYRKLDIHANPNVDVRAIEMVEPGAGRAFKHFLEQASYRHNTARDHFLYRPYTPGSPGGRPSLEMLRLAGRLGMFSSMQRYAASYFTSDAMRKIMQHPLIPLGANPYLTPAALVMAQVDYAGGIFYPQGGMHRLAQSLRSLAERHGAAIRLDSPVRKICVEDDEASGVILESGEELRADIVISGADRHHTDQVLLAPGYGSKTPRYWKSCAMAPSALLIYLGVRGELPSLAHHNLLYSRDWRRTFSDIAGRPAFGKPKWPSDPSVYVCNPSKTDPTVAPAGHETVILHVPVAAGLDYDQEQLSAFAGSIIHTVEREMRLPGLADNIVYRQLFCARDFENRYNSYRGSAFGLAQTLRQSALLRPGNANPKVRGLHYVGADTNPGIGLAACLVSATLVYKQLIGDDSDGPLRPEQVR